jgi:hypothetical protein
VTGVLDCDWSLDAICDELAIHGDTGILVHRAYPAALRALCAA